MEVTTTLRKLLEQRTLDSARGRRYYDAGPKECREADDKSWAEYKAIIAMLGDVVDQDITVEYPD